MESVQKAFEEITKGDKPALEFLSAFYLFVHKQDDLVDRDKPVSIEAHVGFDLNLMRTFGKNEFFQRHQDYLWPVIMTSALAYIASEDRKHSTDVLERITAQVLKSEYMNVIFSVAFCIGGWDWALAMSRKYREYAFDDEKVKA